MSRIKEQRRFFRLNDSLKVSYRKLSPGSGKNTRQSLYPDYGPGSEFETRMQALLNRCRDDSPVVTELISMLDQKLTHVLERIDIGDEITQRVAFKLRLVNISACGMAFSIEEKLEEDQKLNLELVLNSDSKESEEQISVNATVVTCEEQSQGHQGYPYYVRLNFDRFVVSTQKTLIQYLLNRQVQLHRHARSRAAAV